MRGRPLQNSAGRCRNNMPDIFDRLSNSNSSPAMTATPGSAAATGVDIFDRIQQNPATGDATQRPGLGSRIWNGVKQSFTATTAPLRGAFAGPNPEDMNEEAANAAGGQGGLVAYRLARAVTDSMENLIKAPKENYQQAKQDFARAVIDFHNKDWRNALSSSASLAADIEGMTIPGMEPVASRARELSEGARPGGDLATPLARDVTDAATMLALDKAGDVIGKVTGKAEGSKLAQGLTNRSVGALVRDVRYGDPSKALIEEGISALSTDKRLAAVTSKLDELRPQLQAQLATVPGRPVDGWDIMTDIVQDASKKMATAMKSDEEIRAADAELDNLWANVLKRDPNGQLTAAEANEVKQAIGDEINWEKRPNPMHPIIEAAYKKAYAAMKNSVNDAAPDAIELNRRTTNLMAAKNALSEQALAEKAGRGSMTSMNLTQRAEAIAGRAVPKLVQAGKKTGAAASVAGKMAAGAAVAGQVSPRVDLSEAENLLAGRRQ